MKLSLLLLAALAAAGAAAAADNLAQVHTVYILPMSSGLDQYIANRLTESHVLQVVTDPKRADAVLTDRLGPAFEDRLADLYPPPPAPAPKPAADNDKDKDADKAPPAPSIAAETVNKLTKPMSNFGGGKGTIFLVDVKSRGVLWSTYAKPKDTRATRLNAAAGRIVSDLKKNAAGK